MILLWIIFIVAGTLATIYGSFKLSQEWSKKDELKKAHLLPDILLLGCEVELKIEGDLKNKILEKAYSKIYMGGEDVKKIETIPLSPFFDKELYAKEEQAKKNYYISEDVYDKFENLIIIGSVTAKDKNELMKLDRNSDDIILTSEYKKGVSTIKVVEYRKSTDSFKVELSNIQVRVQSQSLLILDFASSKYSLNIIFGEGITPISLEKGWLTTSKTRYFHLHNKNVNAVGTFEGILVSMIPI